LYYGFTVGNQDDGGEPDWVDDFTWGENKGMPDGCDYSYAGVIDYPQSFFYIKELSVNSYWGDKEIPSEFVERGFTVTPEQEALIQRCRELCIERSDDPDEVGQVGWHIAANYG
jgi:hypothetical protein